MRTVPVAHGALKSPAFLVDLCFGANCSVKVTVNHITILFKWNESNQRPFTPTCHKNTLECSDFIHGGKPFQPYLTEKSVYHTYLLCLSSQTSFMMRALLFSVIGEGQEINVSSVLKITRTGQYEL